MIWVTKPQDFISEETINCADYLGGGDGGDGSKKPGENTGGDPHQINVHTNEFEGKLSQFQYIADSEDKSAQDNVVVKTRDDKLWISNNGGESFVEVPVSDKILGFYTGPVAGTVILITDSDIIYVSDDGGATFTKQKAPSSYLLKFTEQFLSTILMPRNSFGLVKIVAMVNVP